MTDMPADPDLVDARDALGLPIGTIRPMVHWGAPIMHRPLAPVTTFDADLAALAADMFVIHSALSGLISPTYAASTFAWGLAFALGVGLLGALYPTWRAVRLAPVAALRHE